MAIDEHLQHERAGSAAGSSRTSPRSARLAAPRPRPCRRARPTAHTTTRGGEQVAGDGAGSRPRRRRPGRPAGRRAARRARPQQRGGRPRTPPRPQHRPGARSPARPAKYPSRHSTSAYGPTCDRRAAGCRRRAPPRSRSARRPAPRAETPMRHHEGDHQVGPAARAARTPTGDRAPERRAGRHAEHGSHPRSSHRGPRPPPAPPGARHADAAPPVIGGGPVRRPAGGGRQQGVPRIRRGPCTTTPTTSSAEKSVGPGEAVLVSSPGVGSTRSTTPIGTPPRTARCCANRSRRSGWPRATGTVESSRRNRPACRRTPRRQSVHHADLVAALQPRAGRRRRVGEQRHGRPTGSGPGRPGRPGPAPLSTVMSRPHPVGGAHVDLRPRPRARDRRRAITWAGTIR